MGIKIKKNNLDNAKKIFGGIFVLCLTILGLHMAGLLSVGFTIDSVSTSVDVISPNTDLSGVWWYVNTLLDYGEQHIVGTITPEQTAIYNTENDYKTQYPLTIVLETQDERMYYDVLNDGIGIYKYSIDVYNAESTTDCNSIGSTTYEWSYYWPNILPLFTNQLWCVKKEQVGVKGTLVESQIKFEAEFTLASNNIAITKIVSNDIQTATFRDPIDSSIRATATWSGSLVKGSFPPKADLYTPYWSVGSKIWKISDYNTWFSYSSQESTTDVHLDILSNQAGDWMVPRDAVLGNLNEAIAEVNSKADTILSSDVVIGAGQLWEEGTTESADETKLYITLDRQLLVPSILFKIRADWLGVYIPTGVPKILNIESNLVGSGEIPSLIVNIKNVGDSEASFLYSLDDCSKFDLRWIATKKPINAGETQEWIIELSHGAIAEQTCDNCIFKVYDANFDESFDTEPIEICIDPVKICIPNQYSIEGNCIKQCNSDGSEVITIECCSNGVEYKDGKYSCIVFPACGNGVCDFGESEENCPVDCEGFNFWDFLKGLFGLGGFGIFGDITLIAGIILVILIIILIIWGITKLGGGKGSTPQIIVVKS